MFFMYSLFFINLSKIISSAGIDDLNETFNQVGQENNIEDAGITNPSETEDNKPKQKMEFKEMLEKLNDYLWNDYRNFICVGTFLPIYEKFNSTEEIVTFLAHSIYLTSGFKCLKAEGVTEEILKENFYISRGIIQITTALNYLMVGDEYFENPEKLESLDPKAVGASVDFYLLATADIDRSSFIETWNILRPVEIEGKNYLLVSSIEKMKHRIYVYNRLCKIFKIKPNFKGKYPFTEKLGLENKDKTEKNQSQ